MPEPGVHKHSDIDKEACAWIAQLDGEEPSAADLEAFREWVNRSARHREAIESLSALWVEMNVLTELAVPPRSSPTFWANPGRAAALAASVILVVALLFGVQRIHTTQPAEFYQTAVGQQRTVALPDGSIVQLNTATQLRVSYSDDSRKLHLLSGEAYFDVEPDSQRPFTVQVDKRIVRAVGTAFSIRHDGASIEVLVTEGVIELREQAKNPGLFGAAESVIGSLTSGQRIRLAEQLEQAESVSPEASARELAWRDGMLSFAGEPLSLVVEEVGRYTELDIVIDDRDLRDLRIGGYFRAGDTEGLLHTLEAGFPIEVIRSQEGMVRLRRRQ
jgi:transmembrane sensor